MIGIKGISKKPITDATAVSSDIISGKVAYNNSGRVVGSISNSSVLKEFTIHIEKGTYTNTTSNISYTYPKGTIYNATISYAYSGQQSSGISINDTKDTIITGVNAASAIYLAEGLFPDEIYKKYNICGISYISSNESDGTPLTEEFFLEYSGDVYNSNPIARKFSVELARFVKTNTDITELIHYNTYNATKYLSLRVYVFNNYWAVAMYDPPTGANESYKMLRADVEYPFDIKLLLVNK